MDLDPFEYIDQTPALSHFLGDEYYYIDQGQKVLIAEAARLVRAFQQHEERIRGRCSRAADSLELLSDPVNLHRNLLQGVPAKLSRKQFLHLAGGCVPQGWRLVPQVATEQMLEAAKTAGQSYADIWAAMALSAPEHPDHEIEE